MLFNSAHAEVQAEGFSETANFSIAASGKAFKGLIDGLYSRKVEAVIRELATNAFDAHKAVGSIAPFEVHLPDALEPTFYIRDFGTGMSHDLMMRRYTTMFDSTKDGVNEEDSAITPNEQVGMLGLGSKSFFAYTDSCTITVWQDGEARYYTVYMGADGIPQIALAGRQPSDEPVGVKVEFPVRSKDTKEFEKAAVRVLKGFPTVPTGMRDRVVEALRVQPDQVGKHFRSYPEDYLPGNGFWAKQGCVLYPIDLTQIDERAVEEDYTTYDYDLGENVTKTRMKLSEGFAQFDGMKATIVIDFPIGTIDFDLGRERLAYNDRTIDALRERWNEMLADLGQALDEAFARADNDFEAAMLAGDPAFKNMGLLFKKTPQYEAAMARYLTLWNGMPEKRSDRWGHHPVYSAMERFEENDDYQIVYGRNKGWPSKDAIPEGFSKSIFILRDKQVGHFNQRIYHLLKDRDLRWAFILEDPTDSFLDLIGRPPMIKATELPPLPKAEREKTARDWVGGSFSRMKVISESGGVRAAEDGDKLDDCLFAFMNCGEVHNPDPDRYPDYPVNAVLRMNRVLRYVTGRSIAFINVKKNEFDKLDRYADAPLFYGCLDDIMEQVSFEQLRAMAWIINEDRFENTSYAKALETWRELFPEAKDELNKLGRHLDRPERIEETTQKELRSILYGQHSEEFRNTVVDYAIAAGIEILPESRARKFQTNDQPFSYPLLPKPWEEMVLIINSYSYTGGYFSQRRDDDDLRFLFTACKEKLGC